MVRVTARQGEEAAHTKQKSKDLRPRRQALLPPIPALKVGKLNLIKRRTSENLAHITLSPERLEVGSLASPAPSTCSDLLSCLFTGASRPPPAASAQGPCMGLHLWRPVPWPQMIGPGQTLGQVEPTRLSETRPRLGSPGPWSQRFVWWPGHVTM